MADKIRMYCWRCKCIVFVDLERRNNRFIYGICQICKENLSVSKRRLERRENFRYNHANKSCLGGTVSYQPRTDSQVHLPG